MLANETAYRTSSMIEMKASGIKTSGKDSLVNYTVITGFNARELSTHVRREAMLDETLLKQSDLKNQRYMPTFNSIWNEELG